MDKGSSSRNRTGQASYCDELGWVSVSMFLQNDYSWPREYPEAHGRTNYTDPKVLEFRAKKLMEGYRHSLTAKSRKRRLLMVGLYIEPEDLEEMKKHKNPDVYTEAMVRKCYGWIRPIAIRATSGHSFKGGHHLPFTEHALDEGTGSKVTSVRNLVSIVKDGLMPGGTVGNRDHVFFGEYAPLGSNQQLHPYLWWR